MNGLSWPGTEPRSLSSPPEWPPLNYCPRLSVSGGRRLLGLPLIALGAVVAAESFRHWRANQRAMERGQPLPPSSMPIVLTVGIVVVGVMAVVVSALGEG